MSFSALFGQANWPLLIGLFIGAILVATVATLVVDWIRGR